MIQFIIRFTNRHNNIDIKTCMKENKKNEFMNLFFNDNTKN